VETLIRLAGSPMFDHRVAQLRQDAQARAAAGAPYAERGYTVLDSRPEWRDQSRVLLHYLRTADGQEATTEVVTDPAQWAVASAASTVSAAGSKP
jgi:ParB family transcriptional regulator, chromosome partitioning protein